LREAIEGEPDVDAETLLTFGVPLGGEEGKTGRDSRLEDSKEESYSNGSGEVFNCSKQTQSCSPHDNIKRRVLSQGESLKESFKKALA